MTRIMLKIESCTGCPHHYATPYPTSDSFERPEYYWCKCPDIKREKKGQCEEDERRRLFIKDDRKFKKLSYVAGYVEWHDKTPIPNWCPLRID